MEKNKSFSMKGRRVECIQLHPGGHLCEASFSHVQPKVTWINLMWIKKKKVRAATLVLFLYDHPVPFFQVFVSFRTPASCFPLDTFPYTPGRCSPGQEQRQGAVVLSRVIQGDRHPCTQNSKKTPAELNFNCFKSPSVTHRRAMFTSGTD